MASSSSFGDANAGFQAGIINGSVSTAFHLPPGELREVPGLAGARVVIRVRCKFLDAFRASANRPHFKCDQSPPPPSILIPFRRDPDFVDRCTILEQVRKKCDAPGSRVALVGLGGIGKSQLAIEHAYRTRERSHRTWAFWVHASNAARFEESFRDMADCVKIAGREDPQADIFKLVHDWLRDSKHRWLIVLDNVDDAQFLLDSQAGGRREAVSSKTTSRRLFDYLPYCECGSILITSRNKEVALKLIEEREVILIQPMDEPQALLLFEKKLGIQDENSNVGELSSALEYMPLAIVQAAANISHRAPCCSVSQYLEEFQRCNNEETSLLDYEAGHLRRDRDADNSIMITWQISFKHLQETKPSAADLLSLMSFFDRQGIPEALLHSQDREETSVGFERRRSQLSWHLKKHEETKNEQCEFEDNITALRDLCFIFVGLDHATFEMHRLVQLATRKWLVANGRVEQWRDGFITRLSTAFPVGEYENWAICQTLFAHAKAAAEQRPKNVSSLENWAILLDRAAWYARERGSFAEAEALAVDSVETLQVTRGGEHETTLVSMNTLDMVYSEKGDLGQAERMQLRVVVISKRKFGKDDPHTLKYMNNLAATYNGQGRWADSEALLVPVVQVCKEKLGENHQDILVSMHNLAIAYCAQGRLDEAEKMDLQMMEIRTRKLGEDHPRTLISISNLADTYHQQGRLDEAEKLHLQVLEIRKTTFQNNHPNTMCSMIGLASVYCDQGRYDNAEELFVQAMKMGRKKFGPDHPATLTCMYNLAAT